jgi:uncharacterized protein YceK
MQLLHTCALVENGCSTLVSHTLATVANYSGTDSRRADMLQLHQNTTGSLTGLTGLGLGDATAGLGDGLGDVPAAAMQLPLITHPLSVHVALGLGHPLQ